MKVGSNIFHLLRLSILVFMLTVACKPVPKSIPSFSHEHPISFDPETYVCHKTDVPIVIDGLDTESSWVQTNWTKDFVDIEGELKPHPTLNTRVKMLWDEDYFYFFAKMEEPHVWATLKNRDDIIYHDDDFEIFIDPDGDSHNYYELEWNAFNTLWDLILLKPYRVDNSPKVLFNWNVQDIKSAVHIAGSLNDPSDVDEYWTIEIAIGWSALKEFASIENYPKDGDQWRVNFSRVDWTMDHDQNSYFKRKRPNGKPLPENNWVWSPTGKVNMHMPEMWGYVQFSDSIQNGAAESFVHNRDEEIKWALWNMYWQQLSFFEQEKHYTSNTAVFTIPKTKQCTFSPDIFTTPYYFEITQSSCDESKVWIINKYGKIYSSEK